MSLLFGTWGRYEKYGLPITQDVDVYAKAHDGGKSHEATNGNGDNHGAYTGKIEYVKTPRIPERVPGVPRNLRHELILFSFHINPTPL